jgi:hypothetical protein
MLLLTAAMTCTSAEVLAYQPPIGIPDPSWGSIHPIDTLAPTQPSRDFAETMSLEPGDVVQLANSSAVISITGHCSAAEPCWILGRGAVLTGRILVSNASYLLLDSVTFDGGTGGMLSIRGANTHHIAVRNSTFANRGWAGNTTAISSIPDLGEAMHDIVIYGNSFSHLGNILAADDQDFHGYGPSLWSRDSTTSHYDIWFLENSCHRLSGDCIPINAGNWSDSQQYLHHIYAGKNEASQNRQGCVWVKQASDVIASQNVAYDMNGGSGDAGHGFGGQYPKDNIWFIFNTAHDSVFGYRQSDTSSGAGDIYLVGNLFYNIRPADLDDYDPANSWAEGTAIALWHGSSNRYLVDNTIHGVYDGVNAIYDGFVELSGNIVSQKDDAPTNHFFDISHPTRNDHVVMDYNLFLDDATESYFVWWNNAGVVESLSEIQSLSGGECGHCVAEIGATAPRCFDDPTEGDFRLVAGCPANRAGTKHPVYDLFEQRYGINIYVDHEGNPRDPVSPSIGAFEYSDNSDDVAPAAPTELTVR